MRLRTCLLASVCGSFALLAGSGCGPSQAEIDQIIDHAAPLVSAIRSYETEHGKAPAALQELVPDHLAAIPGTGLVAYPEYRYRRDPEDPRRWSLSVHLESFGFRHMRLNSTGRYKVPVTTLRDGWVMMDP